jgi:hypothetical protein
MAHHDLQRHDGSELAGRAGMGGTGCQSKTVSVLMFDGDQRHDMGARGAVQPRSVQTGRIVGGSADLHKQTRIVGDLLRGLQPITLSTIRSFFVIWNLSMSSIALFQPI